MNFLEERIMKDGVVKPGLADGAAAVNEQHAFSKPGELLPQMGELVFTEIDAGGNIVNKRYHCGHILSFLFTYIFTRAAFSVKNGFVDRTERE